MTKKHKVLVVDDNENNLKNAIEAMEELGYEVVSASSAKEAIQLIEEVSVREDLFMVLSDMKMEQDDSGIEVLNFCSERCIFCIIVSGGLNHGVQPFISVSFLSNLLARIEDVPTKEELVDYFFNPDYREMSYTRIEAEEKTKKVWKDAVKTFFLAWKNSVKGKYDLVNFIFKTREEFRKNKRCCMTRETQISFYSGISLE